MSPYVTGGTIRELRECAKLTQAELAERLNVSDKTVSKWETGKGYPDITLLEPIAEVFEVSITELLSGNTITNRNISANMMKSRIYICPVCGNIVHAVGEAVVNCHGIQLLPEVAETEDENHRCSLEVVEDEYFIHIHHDMNKKHYISFLLAVFMDGIQMAKLYPEGNPEARVKMRGVRRIYYYCNRDGLYYIDIKERNEADIR